jgi:DNA-binding XRE family transcriptional regulator
MAIQRDWLWDRNISIKKAQKILANPEDEHFLSLASVLLSRKNIPKEVFKQYIKPLDFLSNWQRIKRQMRKDSWNNPRIEFWQAIYEKMKEKYRAKGISISRESKFIKPKDEFCKLIAEKIKALRKQKGLTQEDLAKKLNIAQQVISRIERGRENISLLTLKKISDGLEATIHLEIE